MLPKFGQMLKQTLDKMSEKIEITNEWESGAMDNEHATGITARTTLKTVTETQRQQQEPIVRTFEDFHLGLTRDR